MLRQSKDLVNTAKRAGVKQIVHLGACGDGPVRSKSLDWTLPAANVSYVLSIYGGHFMDMLFHAVGLPASLNAIVKTQFHQVREGRAENSK